VALLAAVWFGASAHSLEFAVGILQQPCTDYEPILRETIAYLNTSMPEHSFRVQVMPATQMVSDFGAGRLDLAFTDPVTFIHLRALHNGQQLVTLQRLEGRDLYAKQGSTLFCLDSNAGLLWAEALDAGARIAAAAEDRLDSWLSVAREFYEVGIPVRKLPRMADVKADDKAVLDAVLGGGSAAGVLRAGAIEKFAAAGAVNLSQIRVLPFRSRGSGVRVEGFPFQITTRLYPEWVIAVHPKVDRRDATGLIIGLLKQPIGADRAARWTTISAFEPVSDVLRLLQIHPAAMQVRVNVGGVRRIMYVGIIAVAITLVSAANTLYVTRLNKYLRDEMRERKKGEKEREQLMAELQERIRETGLLFGLEMAMSSGGSVEGALGDIVNLIPNACGAQETCSARIEAMGREFKTPNFRETEWALSHDIACHGVRLGKITVSHTEKPAGKDPIFTEREVELLEAAANSIGQFIHQSRTNNRG